MTTNRAKLLSVAELHVLHDVEQAHTAHVTALALKLFDITRKVSGFRREHRRLLEAAAMLHDIAFSLNPDGHAEAGARLLLREGIAGFSAADRALICAIVMLHSVRYRDKLDDPLVRSVGDKDLVLRLAACLRIADGLDTEHIQNATLIAADTRRRTVVITLRCGGRGRVLKVADRKADLWREVSGRDIRFVAVDGSVSGDLSPVHSGSTVPEAMRRLMYAQYKNMRDAEDGLASGETEGPVHDLRVAIRRLRALLRIFGRQFAPHSAGDLESDLATLSRALGPSRDLDVWIAQWKLVARKAGPRSRSAAMYTARLLRRQARNAAAVRRMVRSPDYVRLCSRLSSFIRIDIERTAASAGGKVQSLSKFASQQLGRSIRRLERRAGAPLDKASEELHAYRKAVRRARYVAEFFAPVLPAWGAKAAKALNQMATSLGLIHDLDVGTDRLTREFPACPEQCLKRLTVQRGIAADCLKAARRRCRRKKWYRAAVRRT